MTKRVPIFKTLMNISGKQNVNIGWIGIAACRHAYYHLGKFLKLYKKETNILY